MNPILFLALFLGFTVVPLTILPKAFFAVARFTGRLIRDRTAAKRTLLIQRAREDEKEEDNQHISKSAEDTDWERIDASISTLPSNTNGSSLPASASWEGVIGFFHPFCNAGGGGERVLWAAIRATQQRYPKAICVVYTGDHEVDKEAMLGNVETRFNIQLRPARIAFRYLSTRHYVLASTWPRFTLLGQSLGSLVLAWDAFSLVVPDLFIDTMGYAFSIALCRLLLPSIPTCAYVHYPTISTDMLGSLDDESDIQGVNAGLGKGWKGTLKRFYWNAFALLYSRAGASVDVVMTNSSWTQDHITALWGPARHSPHPIEVVFPPVAVEELASAIPVDARSEATRKKDLLFISQFRPEKNHQLIIAAFALFVKNNPSKKEPKLVLVGSVRGDADRMLVYQLRLQAREAGVDDRVEFAVDADWSAVLDKLRTSSVGVNGMWNEHFGIGVVEYQAAGLISVVNDSGGPKRDIVVDIDGKPTGFHASTVEEYADAFEKALGMSKEQTLEMRLRARRSAERFTEAEFGVRWTKQIERLVELMVEKE